MGRYRTIEIELQADEGYQSLSRPGPSGQGLWEYLLRCGHDRSVPGLLTVGLGQLSDELGWSREDVLRVWAEIEAAGMGRADWGARVVWLPRSIRQPSRAPRNRKQITAWGRYWSEIPECALKAEAHAEITRHLGALAPSPAMPDKGPAFAEAFLNACPAPRLRRPFAEQPIPPALLFLGASAIEAGPGADEDEPDDVQVDAAELDDVPAARPAYVQVEAVHPLPPAPPLEPVDEDLLHDTDGALRAIRAYNAHRNPALPPAPENARGLANKVLETIRADRLADIEARKRGDTTAPATPRLHRESGWVAFAERTRSAKGIRWTADLVWWVAGRGGVEGLARREKLSSGAWDRPWEDDRGRAATPAQQVDATSRAGQRLREEQGERVKREIAAAQARGKVAPPANLRDMLPASVRRAVELAPEQPSPIFAPSRPTEGEPAR